MLVKTLLWLQAAETGIETRRVRSIDLPVSYGRMPDRVVGIYKDAIQRIISCRV